MSKNICDRQTISRLSYAELGIDKARYQELSSGCMNGEYSLETLSKACRGLEDVEPWILLSVTQNKSYEAIEYAPKMGRIAVGRTNFYALRRQFYGNLNKVLKETSIGDS